MDENKPACQIDPDTNQATDCRSRDLWLGFYEDFKRRRQVSHETNFGRPINLTCHATGCLWNRDIDCVLHFHYICILNHFRLFVFQTELSDSNEKCLGETFETATQ